VLFRSDADLKRDASTGALLKKEQPPGLAGESGRGMAAPASLERGGGGEDPGNLLPAKVGLLKEVAHRA
jgi:hypothetical protein